MEAVTNRAGVSKALGYSYYPRFEDLLHELFNREFGEIYVQIQAAVDAPGTFEERIRRKVHAYFGTIEDRRDVLLELQRNLQGPEYRRERRARWQLWESYIASLIEGECGEQPGVSQAVARLFMVIDEACIEIRFRLGIPREEMEELCTKFQLAGLQGVLKQATAAPKTPKARSSRSRKTD